MSKTLQGHRGTGTLAVRWLVSCYHWYSEEGTERGRSPRRPPRPFLGVSNVTAHPSTVSVPITVLLYNDLLLNLLVLMCPLMALKG